MTNTYYDPGRVDAVARCLAKMDGEFVSAADWRGETGEAYRAQAVLVLSTIDHYDSGVRSGGLPDTELSDRLNVFVQTHRST